MTQKGRLSAKIRELRLEKGLNRRDLSKQTGISYHTLLAIELERTGVPQVDTLVRIAKFFKISIDELIKGTQFDEDNF